jgi:hypothetical protein
VEHPLSVTIISEVAGKVRLIPPKLNFSYPEVR